MSMAHDPEALLSLLREVAKQELRLDGELDPDAELSAHLDSLQRLALVVAIEDRLQISFEPEEDGEARTLRDVVRILERHLSAERPA